MASCLVGRRPASLGACTSIRDSSSACTHESAAIQPLKVHVVGPLPVRQLLALDDLTDALLAVMLAARPFAHLERCGGMGAVPGLAGAASRVMPG